MNMYARSFTVFVPQLSSWSHSDIINAVIASVAIATLILTSISNRKSNRSAIRGINREERIKLYVPVIALLAGTWVKVDTEILQLRDATFHSPFMVNEVEMNDLQSRIGNYEYDVLETILGNPKLREAINNLMPKLNACIIDLRTVIIQDDLVANGHPPTIQEYAAKRPELLIDLTRKSSQIKEGLEQLRDLAVEELSL